MLRQIFNVAKFCGPSITRWSLNRASDLPFDADY
jgi:hypothetical protein